ncbi:YbbR-like domain-containing protein [Algoriphagus aestuarii]|nr:YbbR-like domain-containing protein [Algoriphagus aestuarii]
MPETKKSSKGISPKKLSDLKVVVLCIAAATTFWILNALNKDDYNTIVDFPIEIVYNEEAYMPVKQLPSSIEIEINGNGWDLLRKYFNINETPFQIDLENPASKDFILTTDLKRSLGDFLSPTQLISVLEDSIQFQIDQVQTVQLKPQLDSSSFSLATNFRLLGDIKFQPSTIKVKGPSSILKAFEGTFPVKMNREKINENINEDFELEIPKNLSSMVSLTEEQINVQFEVVEFLPGNKRLKVKKINFPRTATMENEEMTIMMYYLVDERNLSDLKELEFEAVLNYSQRNKADSTITVKVEPMPGYLDQVRIEPSTIKLKYE